MLTFIIALMVFGLYMSLDTINDKLNKIINNQYDVDQGVYGENVGTSQSDPFANSSLDLGLEDF